MDLFALTGELGSLEHQDLEVASDALVHEQLILEGILHRLVQLLLELDGELAVTSAAAVLDSEHSLGVGGVAEDFVGSLSRVHSLI